MQQFAITRNAFKEIVVVVGGTGITPAIQLIKQVLNDPDDTVSMPLMQSIRSIYHPRRSLSAVGECSG